MALRQRPGAPSDSTWPRGVKGQAASRCVVGRAPRPKFQRRAGPGPRTPRILVMSCLLVLVPITSSTIIEPGRVYQQPASSLAKKCPPGYYLSEHSGDCIACTEKEGFTSHHNSFSSCQLCSKCSEDKIETAPCTTTRDTQCQCKNGTYQDKDSPEYCLACSHRCPDGKVKAKACGPSNNLQCVDQKSGISWWEILLICCSVMVFFIVLVCHCFPGFGAAIKSRIRGWVCCSGTPGKPEALDNAHNLYVSNRDSLSSEEEQKELAGILVQPAGEAQHLLGRAGANGSQTRRKLLVPGNNENPIETLRESFYVFSNFVPFKRWDLFMRLVGLTENAIAVAKAQVLDPQDALYQMLTTWLSTRGKAASVNTLLDSLEKLGERHASEKIEEHLVTSGKYVYEGGEAGSAVSQ